MLMLAWRNVWRNFRRSLLTTASMACGLAAIMFGQSMMKSVQQQLIDKDTSSITSHLQIQNKDSKEPKLPDRYVDDPVPVEKALASQQGVKAWSERIQMTALLSSPSASEGVLVSAIDPEREPKITTMSQYLTEGRFLSPTGKDVVIGERLARKLDVRLGEKVVVMVQSNDGSMGADVFRVCGIFRSGSLTFDASIAYLPLARFQETLGVGKRVNQFVVRLDDIDISDQVRAELSQKLSGKPLKVMTWRDIDHEIVGIQQFQDGILNVILVIVFAIVSLGILNTLLMSFFERVREFGVLMAIGARPKWVLRLIIVESALLGLIGTAGGLALGCTLIAYFHKAGLPLPVGEAFSYFLPFPSVIYMRYIWPRHAFAATSILATSLLAAIAPALRAGRLRPAEALRHV